MAATTVGDYGLFGGGYIGAYDASIAVDAYNASLVHSIATPLREGWFSWVATTVGDYALFGGGYRQEWGSPKDREYYSSTVYAYTVLKS